MIQLTYSNIRQIPEQPGVYKIFARSIENSAIEIGRFSSIDEMGLLYIGRTTSQTLRERLYNFFVTSRVGSRTTNHSGALKYRTVPVIQQRLGQHLLYFECDPCNNPAQAERDILISYRHTFGEYPPLNK
jgi:hypothetical protein